MPQHLSQNEKYWTTLSAAEERELAASVVQWIDDLRSNLVQHSKANASNSHGSFERICNDGSETAATRPESALDRYLNNLRKWQLDRIAPERLQVIN